MFLLISGVSFNCVAIEKNLLNYPRTLFVFATSMKQRCPVCFFSPRTSSPPPWGEDFPISRTFRRSYRTCFTLSLLLSYFMGVIFIGPFLTTVFQLLIRFGSSTRGDRWSFDELWRGIAPVFSVKVYVSVKSFSQCSCSTSSSL